MFRGWPPWWRASPGLVGAQRREKHPWRRSCPPHTTRARKPVTFPPKVAGAFFSTGFSWVLLRARRSGGWLSSTSRSTFAQWCAPPRPSARPDTPAAPPFVRCCRTSRARGRRLRLMMKRTRTVMMKMAGDGARRTRGSTSRRPRRRRWRTPWRACQVAPGSALTRSRWAGET